ncbi:hypothetical protein BCR39DRAFT_509614 [Naematelia encephala]|uniref:Methyltransferase-domain-containing protein n=1 Tax=Naematelia encephala TaxID=71784 RepID=A0A1Y2BLG7_9TREE|nr:hypothetical protein BCR39DRAFT_509614 [Naematelia encephala]
MSGAGPGQEEEQEREDRVNVNVEGQDQVEDATDIFDTSLSTLFSIPPIAFSTSSPSSLYTYNPPPSSSNTRPIYLRLPQPPAKLYTTLQAQNLWLSAVFLADSISTASINLSGRIAELGAGAGLPGIVCCRNGLEVVSSDWGVVEVLDAIRDNFKRSCPEGNWNVVGHRWGTDPKPLLTAKPMGNGDEMKFDELLLADVLWVTDAHKALLDSIFSLLKHRGTAHVAAGLHTGRGPVERFIRAAEARGASTGPIKEVRWRAEGGWDDYVFNTTSSELEEERGVVVYFKLHI